MPGLVGFVTKQAYASAKAQLAVMLKTVQYEPFYGSGTWADESLGAYVGWTSLKGSFSDGMPISNEREDIYLIFCGEEHPDCQSVPQLRKRGHQICPAEAAYLVHLYEDERCFVRNYDV